MSKNESQEAGFMARAIELAKRGWGCTHPNPLVGAVIVENDVIVAEGWHRAAGQPHAEIEALRALGRQPAPEATLFITLEPCSTTGRTGACTDAILQSGIRRVIIGAIDPNPDHCGKGLDFLRQAGIEVSHGLLDEECEDLNLIFNHWIKRQTPLLAAKIATTLDGKFSAANGHSKWVTGQDSRQDVMRWRRYFPAIAVSAKTALADNPALTSRLPEGDWCPRRFIFDRCMETRPGFDKLRLFSDAHKDRSTLICSETIDPAPARDTGIDLWQLPEKDGHLDIDAFRERCADEAIHAVYIEPGPRWASALLSERSIDYFFHYIAPKYLSDNSAPGIGAARNTQSISDAFPLVGMNKESMGDDILIRGWLDR